MSPLHIAAESLADADPAKRLENIEQVVAAVQSDALEVDLAEIGNMLSPEDEADADAFRPAGIVGPETEIIFHGEHHPFEDAFQEEEIVIDQYASLDSGEDINLVRVNSAESLAIAQLLDQSAVRPASDSPPIIAAPEPETPDEMAGVAPTEQNDATTPAEQIDRAAHVGERPTVAFSIVGEHDADLSSQPQREEVADSSDGGALPETASHAPNETSDAGAESLAPENISEIGSFASDDAPDPVMPEYAGAGLPQRNPVRSNEDPAASASDDRDLIIVESLDEAPTPTSSPGTARRMEYRRLFAKLRSG